jgi:DNA-binding NarL/FixJ family response regulator
MANTGISNGRVRVAVLDDDEDTRLCLKDILQSQKDFTFAGGFSTGKEALKAIPGLRPDLALVDIGLPDMDGIECAKQLRPIAPSVGVIIVSGNRDTNSFDRSRAAGAITYIIKPFESDQLIAALHLAVGRSYERNSSLNSRNIGFPSKSNKKSSLSPREEEVLSRLADGLYLKEISDKLGITIATVHKHSHNLYRKLGVNNRTEATRVWIDRNR